MWTRKYRQVCTDILSIGYYLYAKAFTSKYWQVGIDKYIGKYWLAIMYKKVWIDNIDKYREE